MSGTKPLTGGLDGFEPVAGGSVSGASPTGATFGFASAIASRPFSMAEPMRCRAPS